MLSGCRCSTFETYLQLVRESRANARVSEGKRRLAPRVGQVSYKGVISSSSHRGHSGDPRFQGCLVVAEIGADLSPEARVLRALTLHAGHAGHGRPRSLQPKDPHVRSRSCGLWGLALCQSAIVSSVRARERCGLCDRSEIDSSGWRRGAHTSEDILHIAGMTPVTGSLSDCGGPDVAS